MSGAARSRFGLATTPAGFVLSALLLAALLASASCGSDAGANDRVVLALKLSRDGAVPPLVGFTVALSTQADTGKPAIMRTEHFAGDLPVPPDAPRQVAVGFSEIGQLSVVVTPDTGGVCSNLSFGQVTRLLFSPGSVVTASMTLIRPSGMCAVDAGAD